MTIQLLVRMIFAVRMTFAVVVVVVPMVDFNFKNI